MLRSLNCGQKLTLIVVGAPCVDVAVANRWLEGGANPFIKRIRWLDVVVAIDSQCRGIRSCCQPFGRNNWMPSWYDIHNLNFHALPGEPVLQPISCLPTIFPMFGKCR